MSTVDRIAIATAVVAVLHSVGVIILPSRMARIWHELGVAILVPLGIILTVLSLLGCSPVLPPHPTAGELGAYGHLAPAPSAWSAEVEKCMKHELFRLELLGEDRRIVLYWYRPSPELQVAGYSYGVGTRKCHAMVATHSVQGWEWAMADEFTHCAQWFEELEIDPHHHDFEYWGSDGVRASLIDRCGSGAGRVE